MSRIEIKPAMARLAEGRKRQRTARLRPNKKQASENRSDLEPAVRLTSPTENESELHSNEVTEQTVRAARRLETQQRKRNHLDMEK
jgi:hypothetical protein